MVSRQEARDGKIPVIATGIFIGVVVLEEGDAGWGTLRGREY
jgi:hypothetical protein